MPTYAVKYTQPLLGASGPEGYLVGVPGASVVIRQNGVACSVYSNRTKTAMANPVPTGVAAGTAGVDTYGNLLVFLNPGTGYDAVVTVGGVASTVTLPDVSPDIADVQAPIPDGTYAEEGGTPGFELVTVEPVPADDGAFKLKGRNWAGIDMGVPYVVPSGPTANQRIAFDLVTKGNPTNVADLGVAWLDICDSNEAQVDADDYQATRIGKTKDGYGYLTVAEGDGGIGTNPNGIPLALQHMGGSVLIGSTDDDSGGVGVLGLADAEAAPTANPTGGVVLFSEGGRLKAQGAAGAASSLVASADVQLPGAPVLGSVVDTNPTAIPLTVIDGVVYGRGVADFGRIYKLNADGATWTLVTDPAAGGAPVNMRLLGDGEVLVTANTARKSTGWQANPATATWRTVATPTAGASWPNFGVAIHNNLVLMCEYAVPREPSVKAILSTDYGATFATVRDLDVMYPGQSAAVHWHGAGIDGFKTGTPRLWLSHGDGPRKVIYSDDLGATWTDLPGTYAAGAAGGHQPTAIESTPYGMVFGTDQTPDGVYRVVRTADPAAMVYEPILMFRYGNNATGSLYTFAIATFRDPATGLVYMTFNSDLEKMPAVVVATDGLSASIVYETAPGTATVQPKAGVAVVADKKLLFSYRINADYFLVRGGTVRQGAVRYPPKSTYPEGGSGLGIADRSSVGIGANVVAERRSVVIGDSAVEDAAAQFVTVVGETARGGHRSVALGQGAIASGDMSSALGRIAQATGESATAIGQDAQATAAQATAIGAGTRATVLASVAIGFGVQATAQAAVVIGAAAAVTGNNGVSIGNASSGGSGAAAYGYDADAGDNCVAVGDRAKAYQTSGGAGITQATAVGPLALAQQFAAAAYGYDARATGINSISIGAVSRASHNNATALGQAVSTTANSQVAIGACHIELTELSADAAAPAANGARWYVKDNGAGKTQLCVRFATGAVQVIATEP